MKKNEETKQPSQAQKKENTAIAKPHNVLEAFEQIAELAKGSKLNEEFWPKAAPHIQYAAKKLKLSDKQVTLLALFVEHCGSDRIWLSNLADYNRMQNDQTPQSDE